MKTFFEPKVILVARPALVWAGVDQLMAEYDGIPGGPGWDVPAVATDGDLLPELMGRLCYGSFGSAQGRRGPDYLAHVIEGGHGSVLEHANWSFVACRASRGFTHQMVRHRAGFAFSQESQHFVRYGDEPEKGIAEARLCMTGLERISAMHMAEAETALEDAVRAYEQLWSAIRATFPDSAKGVKKETSGAARGLLPTALESRLGFTANARALRHFCELRGNADNVLEIRLVAAQVAKIMKEEAPYAFQDVAVEDGGDGWPTVRSTWRKV